MWGLFLVYEAPVVQVSKQGCVSITSWQHLTWHFMTPAPHTKSFSYYYFNYFRHAVAKICRSTCWVPFCGAPVRPNMLNMPKSASDHHQAITAIPLHHHCIAGLPIYSSISFAGDIWGCFLYGSVICFWLSLISRFSPVNLLYRLG